MGFDVSVDIDLKGVDKKVSPEAFARGQLALTNQMLLDMNRFVPVRSRALRNSGHVRKDSVVYNMPYARLRFFGRIRKGFFSDKQRRFFFANKDRLLAHKPKPGTGPRWDKKASALYIKKWEEVALKGMGVK